MTNTITVFLLFGGVLVCVWLIIKSILQSIELHDRASLIFVPVLVLVGLSFSYLAFDLLNSDYLDGWQPARDICVYEETGALAPCDEVRR